MPGRSSPPVSASLPPKSGTLSMRSKRSTRRRSARCSSPSTSPTPRNRITSRSRRASRSTACSSLRASAQSSRPPRWSSTLSTPTTRRRRRRATAGKIVRYIDAISGEGSTMDVVSLLIEAGRTSVAEVLSTETGIVIVDNREFPADAVRGGRRPLGGDEGVPGRRARPSAAPRVGTVPGWRSRLGFRVADVRRRG